MKVWIDLANSPHPLLFAPVARRLESEGHDVLVTARDHAQTLELAQERWPGVDVIGGESPRGNVAKVATIGSRIVGLRRWAAAARPQVALSHNSYAQIVAAQLVRIPAVTAMDYEHQPANHIAFRLAKTVLLPQVLPLRALRGQGAVSRKVVQYPGLKEELYIGDFEPDPAVLAKLGIDPRPRALVVARTPPSRAVYHPFGNPLFEEALRTVCSDPDVVCVTLTRHPEQIAAIEKLGLRNCIVPRCAIDSRSLMYAADALVGAGGTMTREGALMGIPTWTLFAGTRPAVDVWLELQGMLSRLTRADELRGVGARSRLPRSVGELRKRGALVEQVFLDATVAAGLAGAPCSHPRHHASVATNPHDPDVEHDDSHGESNEPIVDCRRY